VAGGTSQNINIRLVRIDGRSLRPANRTGCRAVWLRSDSGTWHGLISRYIARPLPLSAIPEDGAWNVSRVERDQIPWEKGTGVITSMPVIGYPNYLLINSLGRSAEAEMPVLSTGIFLGFRGRHMRDMGQWDEAERDYLLARHLFPSNRKLYIDATEVAVDRSVRLFEPGELGSPQGMADWLNTQYRVARPMARVQAKDFPVQNVSYTASV
jgi:hypothetical protein